VLFQCLINQSSFFISPRWAVVDAEAWANSPTGKMQSIVEQIIFFMNGVW
jgi:hypothetical protein